LALTIAASNDLEVKVGDLLNFYITAPITKKVWTILGPEFEPDAYKSAIIVKALYSQTELRCGILCTPCLVYETDGIHIL
jgi:hypothetical protein